MASPKLIPEPGLHRRKRALDQDGAPARLAPKAKLLPASRTGNWNTLPFVVGLTVLGFIARGWL